MLNITCAIHVFVYHFIFAEEKVTWVFFFHHYGGFFVQTVDMVCTTILIAFLCYNDGGKSYIFKDIANHYFLLKVSLIFFRPSLILFCIHVFLVSHVCEYHV